MTTNTAENATAGVVRQRVLELAHTRMELDLAQWSDISNDFLRAADELDTARAEIERLRAMLTATEKHGSVYAAVERVLDERSAWVTRPNHETTMRVALAATIAANELLGDPVGKVADAQCAVTNAEMARDDEQERADRAESALTAAQERIAELEGVLKPFAKCAEHYARNGYNMKEAVINQTTWGSDGTTAAVLTRGDFHDAAATLSPAVKEPK